MSKPKSSLGAAIVKMLEPIARILLRNNVAYSEFAELARRAYVNAAYRFFSISKRKQTVSRVSVLTGLSRKEVVRVSALDLDQPEQIHDPKNRAIRVVGGWIKDPDFVDENKLPRIIELKSGENDFEELVRRYSGGITARAILDELVRVNAVEVQEKKYVKLKHYGYVPSGDLDLINVISTHVSDLLNTCVYNMTKPNNEPTRFQRQVTYFEIPESLAREFQEYSHEKLLSLILESNQWLSNRRKTHQSSDAEKTCRVGVGAYYFENENEG